MYNEIDIKYGVIASDTINSWRVPKLMQSYMMELEGKIDNYGADFRKVWWLDEKFIKDVPSILKCRRIKKPD